jgi:integrase|tara:strand:+ start:426 stop:1565 length:1140 start_codon:yes stop_codon:yes gene_type:complete
MREEVGIWEDEKTGFLRVRIPELREEGKRSPTYNLCTLDYYNKDPKKKRERTPKQRDSLVTKLYLEVRAKKQKKFEIKEKVILVEADKHSVSETIDKYLNEILPSRSKSAQELFSQQLEFWRDKFGSYKLSKLDPLEIKIARDGLKTESRSNSTLNRYLGSFSAVLGCAVKDFLWMDENPCNKIRKLSEPKSRIRFLSLEEKEVLLSHCDPDLHDAVMLALLTGARKAEIWKLRYDAINFKRKFISFLITKSGTPRSVPMSNAIHEIILRRARENSFRSPFVFPSPVKHNRPNDFGRTWKTTLRNAKISDFRWHDLRHTSASYMVMAGISLRTVADVLGHTNISMTFKYAHLSPLHLSSALDSLSDELAESKAKVKKLS